MLDRLSAVLETWRQGDQQRPAWVGTILDAVQKQSRANLKHQAKVEAAHAQASARLQAISEELDRIAQLAIGVQREREDEEYAPLFDALDALDEAAQRSGEPHVVSGLARVADRITAFCEGAGLRRVSGMGEVPDARWMRVVGSEVGPPEHQGKVGRVVRAAVLRGQRLVREGEVIVVAAGGSQDEEHSREDQHG